MLIFLELVQSCLTFTSINLTPNSTTSYKEKSTQGDLRHLLLLLLLSSFILANEVLLTFNFRNCFRLKVEGIFFIIFLFSVKGSTLLWVVPESCLMSGPRRPSLSYSSPPPEYLARQHQPSHYQRPVIMPDLATPPCLATQARQYQPSQHGRPVITPDQATPPCHSPQALHLPPSPVIMSHRSPGGHQEPRWGGS